MGRWWSPLSGAGRPSDGPYGRPRPIVWAGEEIDRSDLGGRLTDLAEASGVPFCTTVGAKAVVDEDLPRFHGVYNGHASHPDVHRIFKDLATCRIGLGAWSTSKNLGGEQCVGTDWVMAANGGVSVGISDFRLLGRTGGVPGHRCGRRVPNVREKGRGRGQPCPLLMGHTGVTRTYVSHGPEGAHSL